MDKQLHATLQEMAESNFQKAGFLESKHYDSAIAGNFRFAIIEATKEAFEFGVSKSRFAVLLNALLFRDMHGNAYGDDCAQNRIVKKIAADFGITLDLKEPEIGESSRKARKEFGTDTMK